MKLVRDEAPFYQAFHDDALIGAVKQKLGLTPEVWTQYTRFKHLLLPRELGASLIDKLPFGASLGLMAERVSAFITPPRTYYRAHKDGFTLRFGLNMPVHIADQRSITRWWSDDVASKYQMVHEGKHSRELKGFNPLCHTPDCSFVMQPTEIVLLNVEKYHDFHNKSDQHRVILTFRSKDFNLGFDDAVQRMKSFQEA